MVQAWFTCSTCIPRSTYFLCIMIVVVVVVVVDADAMPMPLENSHRFVIVKQLEVVFQSNTNVRVHLYQLFSYLLCRKFRLLFDANITRIMNDHLTDDASRSIFVVVVDVW